MSDSNDLDDIVMGTFSSIAENLLDGILKPVKLESKAYGIWYKGQRIKIGSKDMWAKPGYAKSAITDKIGYNFRMILNDTMDIRYKDSISIYQSCITYLMENSILEIKEL